MNHGKADCVCLMKASLHTPGSRLLQLAKEKFAVLCHRQKNQMK